MRESFLHMSKYVTYLEGLVVLLFISLSFIGTDCNNTTTQVTNENIQGNWQLISSTGGSEHDLCPGEKADFQSNGIAILTCPNQQPINRSYSVSNSVLTFNETSVKYTVNLTNNSNTLNMYGIGMVSGRILVYDRITSYDKIKLTDNNNSKNKNLSDK